MNKEIIKIPKDKLENLYYRENLGTYKIAKLFNCSAHTIRRKLLKYNIKTKPITHYWTIIPREKLYSLYWKENKPLTEISKVLNRSPSVIAYYLKKYGILCKKYKRPKEKEQLLIANYPFLPKKELLKLFPNKSMRNLAMKRIQLRKKGNNLPERKRLHSQEKCNKLNDFERGWLSALIDGEGSISLLVDFEKSLRIHAKVVISNTSYELLKKVREVLGIGFLRQEYRKKPKRTDMYSFAIYSFSGIASLLEQIQPVLIIKKRIAELVLKFLKNRLKRKEYTTEDAKFCRDVYILNRRTKTFGFKREKFRKLEEIIERRELS